MTYKPFEWKEKEVREAIAKSPNIKKSLIALGLYGGGSHHIKINQMIEDFDIDTSHFTSQRARKLSEFPHKDLIPYLEKYDITWEAFSKRGRVPKEIKNKRISLITDIHASGMSWETMIEVSGMSLGFVQRNTNAVGNPESHKNRQENARITGKAGKGKKCPKTSQTFRRLWREGVFDYQRGSTRSEETVLKIREFWSCPKLRQDASIRMKKQWKTPSYREPLMEFHTSEEERCARSKRQINNLKRIPSKYARGNGCHLPVSKCVDKSEIYVRSSYEKAAVGLLEKDEKVLSYKYEMRVELSDGKWILPDFLVTYEDKEVLVEVKASWVLRHPSTSKERKRLKLAEKYAHEQGWDFDIWTEQDRLKDVV